MRIHSAPEITINFHWCARTDGCLRQQRQKFNRNLNMMKVFWHDVKSKSIMANVQLAMNCIRHKYHGKIHFYLLFCNFVWEINQSVHFLQFLLERNEQKTIRTHQTRRLSIVDEHSMDWFEFGANNCMNLIHVIHTKRPFPNGRA